MSDILYGALWRDVEKAKRDRKLTWVQVAEQVGVSASTLRRFGNSNSRPETFVGLLHWLGYSVPYATPTGEGQGAGG